MAEHKTVKPSKEDIERAQLMWSNFLTGSTYALYATLAILIGLALAFVEFG